MESLLKEWKNKVSFLVVQKKFIKNKHRICQLDDSYFFVDKRKI